MIFFCMLEIKNNEIYICIKHETKLSVIKLNVNKDIQLFNLSRNQNKDYFSFYKHTNFFSSIYF